jgi:hypothetical protein
LRTLLSIALATAVLLCTVALASSESETIDVAQIRPGMKGYGLSVFRGTQPERFDVEVIDVLKNFRPDQDLILVRTHHPILEKAMVVGGMSGSPVYLEGKLAGAYAYGWLFGKEPVVGVTPIANMLAEMARPVDPAMWKAVGSQPQLLGGQTPVASSAPRRRSVAHLAGLPPYLGKERLDAFSPLRQHAAAQGYAREAERDGTALQAAATPIMLSGLHESVATVLHDELERFGLVTLQAGAAGASKDPPGAGAASAGAAPDRFVDGGAIGVEMMRGDINATAIGTVTYVRGDRLVAFGHPMMNAGQPALPTCTARVLHVLANERRSFKIGEAATSLGTLIQDRQAAIVIDTKLKADSVPMHLRVSGVPGAQRTEWNVRLASHRMMTPLLAFSALGNALSVTASDNTDVVYEARSRVRVQGHGVVETRDVGYSAAGFDNAMSLAQIRLFETLGAAYGNPFEDSRVEDIDVELSVRFEPDVMMLLEALAPSTEVDPDSDVDVYLTLQRFGEPQQVKIVKVHVPASAAGEKIEVAFEPGNVVQVERPEPENLDQIFDNVRLGYPSTSLVISTKLPSQGLRLRGHVARNLPGSVLDTLQLTGDSDKSAPFPTVVRDELPMQHLMTGSARLTLDVRREPLR